MRCEEGLESSCVAYRCPVVPAPHVEKTALSYLITLSSCQKPIGHMCFWLYFCAFSSVPLTYVFVLLPKSRPFDCSSFMACLEIRLCADSNFCLLSHVLPLTFYLEIILDLQKCCKNGTENSPRPLPSFS